MKKLLTFFCIMFIVFGYTSCTKKEVNVQDDPPRYTREELETMLTRNFYFVDRAYHISGSDTIDIAGSGPFNELRNGAFLSFSNGMVFFNTGSPTPNNAAYPLPAKLFNINVRIEYPTDLTYAWDDAQKTIVVKAVRQSQYFKFIPPGSEASLVQDRSEFYSNLEEAKTSPPARVTFTYIDEAPASGPVTYTVLLRPLWEYQRQGSFADFVGF